MHTDSPPALWDEDADDDAQASNWPLGLAQADWQRAVGDVLFECWLPTRQLRCSAQLRTLLELSALPSDPWEALRERVHPEDRAGLRHALDACWRSKTGRLRHEYRLRTDQGHYRWVLIRGLLIERRAWRAPAHAGCAQ